VNRDPIGEEGGLNPFGFVVNSPGNDYDRFGLKCCLLTWNFGHSQGGSLPNYGHSALKCDGVYVSAWPSKDKFPPMLTESPVWWHESEQIDEAIEKQKPDSVTCSDCLDEGKIATWLKQIQSQPATFKGNSSNCSDYTTQAMIAGLDPSKQIKPSCPQPCGQYGFLIHPYVETLLNPVGLTTPGGVKRALELLNLNGCNNYRCNATASGFGF
jgi:hypothetical protein